MDPLVFEPYLRPQVWGGRRLETCLGKCLPAAGRFGESWEISAHRHHPSRVVEGPWKGHTLDSLWANQRAELCGDTRSPAEPFPLLLKFLDCDQLLSVQVHPDDATAARLLPGELGKTEAWVVLDVGPQGTVYAGLRPGTTAADLERHLDAGTVDQCLHAFRPQVGDCIFLAAGTVHAVGGGVLMAEIQQSSDATFRLFDWNRLGDDGQPRTLHRQQSFASINWSAGPVAPVTPAACSGLPPGVRGEKLVACPQFNLDRFVLGAAMDVPYGRRWSLWSVVSGQAVLAGPAWQRRFSTGQSVLIPATAEGLCWLPDEGGREVVILGARGDGAE